MCDISRCRNTDIGVTYYGKIVCWNCWKTNTREELKRKLKLGE